jgi:hypothetical protein
LLEYEDPALIAPCPPPHKLLGALQAICPPARGRPWAQSHWHSSPTRASGATKRRALQPRI